MVLTFDDGPNPPDTDRLLDVLAHHQVPAVFCLVGEQVVAHPDRVVRIVDAGHLLGNHSWKHDDLSAMTREQVHADLTATLHAIHTAAPGATVPFYRAPYGNWGDTIDVATTLGMIPLEWNLVVEDWDPPGVPTLLDRLLTVTPGSIILLHDGGGERSNTVDAVAELIPRLRAAGWTFTVPQVEGSSAVSRSTH